MSSGLKQLIVNPLERALSTDIMRAQSFSGAMLQELLRSFMNTAIGTDEIQSAGLDIVVSTQQAPSSAQIFSGLMFQPIIGGTSSVVTQGVVSLLDPDTTPSTDDSQYKLVEDPGTSALTLTANVSGSVRIDIVECARVQPDNIIETDSRDIFNTVTGLFAAATVNKVSLAQMQYRIRTGGNGSGYPGALAGWLPLAIISVPSGTSTWDTCTVWDVRPLVTDRPISLSTASLQFPRRKKLEYSSHSGTGVLNGICEVDAGNIRLGGQLLRGSPETSTNQDFPYIDFTDAQNQEAGFSVASGTGLAYLYYLQPQGLPRWARYQNASGSPGTYRLPRSPRGIPIISKVAPYDSGVASAAITPPTTWGFAGSAFAGGVCFGAIGYTGGALQSAISSDGWQSTQITQQQQQTAAGPGYTFPGPFNYTYPWGAKRIRIQLSLSFTINPGVGGFVANLIPLQPVLTITSGGDTQTLTLEEKLFPNTYAYTNLGQWSPFEIELSQQFPQLSTQTALNITVTFSTQPANDGVTYNACRLNLLGWKYDCR